MLETFFNQIKLKVILVLVYIKRQNFLGSLFEDFGNIHKGQDALDFFAVFWSDPLLQRIAFSICIVLWTVKIWNWNFSLASHRFFESWTSSFHTISTPFLHPDQQHSASSSSSSNCSDSFCLNYLLKCF